MVRIDVRRLAFWFLLVTLALLVATQARADEGVQVTMTPDRGEMAIGDPVQLTLEATHPAGYQVIIPKLEPVWGEFEVRSQSQATTVANDDGTETTQQLIEVTLFNLGDFQTPELPLTISNGAGKVTEVAAPPASLAVIPTLAEDDTELRDIKPQASLAVPPAWPWIAGGLLLATVATLGGWWAYRRWQGKPFGLAPVIDNRPPWQIAFDELVRIESLGLPGQGRIKEYYTLIADCLRTYLENQFHLRVFDRTTSELKPILAQSDLSPEQARRLLDLFREGDLVKFAKFVPDPATASLAILEARSFVEATMSKPELEAATEHDPPTAPVPTRRLSYQSGR